MLPGTWLRFLRISDAMPKLSSLIWRSPQDRRVCQSMGHRQTYTTTPICILRVLCSLGTGAAGSVRGALQTHPLPCLCQLTSPACLCIKIHQFLDQVQDVASAGGNGSADHGFALSSCAFLPSVDQIPVLEWKKEGIPHLSSQRWIPLPFPPNDGHKTKLTFP